jgi:Starch/carbohydrate-binding module (family 53)
LILVVLMGVNGGSLGVLSFAFLLACAAITLVNVSFNRTSTAIWRHLSFSQAGAQKRNAGMAAIESLPSLPLAGESVTITYQGHLALTAKRITMHWGYSNFRDVFLAHWGQTYWNGVTDTPMTKQDNGSWKVTITIPFDANALNMAFYDQSRIWDNNNRSNYHVSVLNGFSSQKEDSR